MEQYSASEPGKIRKRKDGGEIEEAREESHHSVTVTEANRREEEQEHGPQTGREELFQQSWPVQQRYLLRQRG